MECSGFADMVEKIARDVVVGRDSVLSSDDPESRTIGFEVRGHGRMNRYYVRLTRSVDGLDPYLLGLIGSQDGRAKIASIMEHGVEGHGHGYEPSRDCRECLALEIMEG